MCPSYHSENHLYMLSLGLLQNAQPARAIRRSQLSFERTGASRATEVYPGGRWPNCRAVSPPRRHPAALHPLSQRKPQPKPRLTIDSRGRRPRSQLARDFEVFRYLETCLYRRSTILTPATASDSTSICFFFLISRFI